MMVLISYDVMTSSKGGKTRLRRVAKECENYGIRVQGSVFECNVDPAQWIAFRTKLESIIKTDKDSLRYYYLGSNWRRRVEHVGAKKTIDTEGPMII
jgi:CRISPR-associated protein Cas2